MRRRNAFIPLAALAIASCTAGPPVSPSPTTRLAESFSDGLLPLEQAIRARLAQETGDFGVSLIDMETGRRIGVNDELVMHAASTMKVPVLLELYRRAAEGTLDLDGKMTVRTRFRSIVDTSHYFLSVNDDSETDLYRLAGTQVTLRELARRMIVRSSNLATNLLIDTLGAPAVMRTLGRIDGLGMTVRRGVEDGPAFAAGLNNTTTARGLANVLAAVARCDMVLRQYCAEVVNVLAAQEFNDMIPSGLPAGTRIAHKTGSITGIQHDGGIIFRGDVAPFILVVLTRNAKDAATAKKVAGDVARLAWDALGPGGTARPPWSAELTSLVDTYRNNRFAGTFPESGVKYDELWGTLTPLLARTPSFTVEEIGRSAQGRAIRAVSYGTGPTSVLLWSQMHGDEPTATRALADLFHFIATQPDDPHVKLWRETLSIHAIPMLNPDGAELDQRRDAFGVDVNRDARNLRTPEGRALKAAQEKYRPLYGFNLHDQNPRTRVDRSDRLAAIALLAPPPDAGGTMTPGYDRALRLTSYLGERIEPMIRGHLTRYDDTFNPRAFGDLMESWGVATMLIEAGTWHDDPAKFYLRKVEFVALVTALDAIATGGHMSHSADFYHALPENGRSINGLLIRGGTVVVPGLQSARIDIAINEKSVGSSSTTEIVDIGDLDEVVARDTIDATGLFLHPEPAALKDAGGILKIGMYPSFVIRRTADPASDVVWRVNGIDVRRY